MSFESNLEPAVVTEFGGLCTVSPVGDCPKGMSPDSRNVMFSPGALRSRDGFRNYWTDDEGGIEYWSEFITPDGTLHKLLCYDTGCLKLQTAEGGAIILAPGKNSTDGTFVAATRPMATTLLGRTFIALGDGQVGQEVPRQYSPTLGGFFPVAPDGPGVGPAMAGGYPQDVALPDGMTTIDHAAVNFLVVFVTKTGFVTAPSPPLAQNTTDSGTVNGRKWKLTNIAVGPYYVTERWIFQTRSDGSPGYFHVPGGGMQIKNNTATSTDEFGYSDAVLQGGLLLDNVSAPPLAEQSGFLTFNRRLVAWGGKVALSAILSQQTSYKTGTVFGTGYFQGPLNWRFEGGNDGSVPNGWNSLAAGGSLQTSATAIGDVYRFTGGSGTGELASALNVVTSVDGVSGPFLPGLKYEYRVRMRRSAGASGTFRVTGTANLDINIATQIGTDWTVITGGEAILNPHLLVPSADIPNGEWVELDRMHAYEKGFPVERSILRVSRSDEPEAFDDPGGLIPVSTDDGQAIVACFELRGALYIVKERSIWYTYDNGGNPSDWLVQSVSLAVGTESPRGVAVGDGWAVICNRNGCYLFTGGVPDKISIEVDDVWRATGFDIDSWVVVDPERQQLVIRNGDRIFYLDHFEGISQAGTYQEGHGRKWTYFTLSTTGGTDVPAHGALAVRSAGGRDVMVAKKTTASNDVQTSILGDGIEPNAGTFPGTSAGAWFGHIVGVLPSVTAGKVGMDGETDAWQWVFSNVVTEIGIPGSNYVTATHACGAVDLKNVSATPISVTAEIRYYSGTGLGSGHVSAATKTFTITTDWLRLDLSTLDLATAGASPGAHTGFAVLLLTFPANASVIVGRPSVQTDGYDHGYVRSSTGPSSGRSTVIQAQTRAQEFVRDSDAAIDSYYVGAPMGLPSGRSSFIGMEAKVWGSGSLRTWLYQLHPYGEVEMATSSLIPYPIQDLELNFRGQGPVPAFISRTPNWRVGLVGLIDPGPGADPTGYWNLSSLTIFSNRPPTPRRGAD